MRAKSDPKGLLLLQLSASESVAQCWPLSRHDCGRMLQGFTVQYEVISFWVLKTTSSIFLAPPFNVKLDERVLLRRGRFLKAMCAEWYSAPGLSEAGGVLDEYIPARV